MKLGPRKEGQRFFVLNPILGGIFFFLDTTSPFCEVGGLSFARTQNSEVGVVKRAAY